LDFLIAFCECLEKSKEHEEEKEEIEEINEELGVIVPETWALF